MLKQGGAFGSLFLAWALASTSHGAGLILNEYNAVGPTDTLGNDRSDTFFGIIEGNGRDWIEVVVVDDHLDIRGWELQWYQEDADATGEAIWDDTRTTPGFSGQGRIVFSDDDDWSDLRRGTILTISEQERLTNVFDFQSGETRSFDLRTDMSFDPAANDWWIHVSSEDEAENTTPLVTTESNIEGDVPGNFAVGNDNWEMRIVDDDGEIVFGPIGEAVPGWTAGGAGGLSDREVGKLESPASPGTLAQWQTLGIGQFRDGSSSSFGSPNVFGSGTTTQDFSPLREIEAGVDGDTDGDGDVDLDDLNNVRNNFGSTGTGVAGDTDGDNDVDLDDLNAVRNNFGAAGSQPVPEPSTLFLATIGVGAFVLRRRCR